MYCTNCGAEVNDNTAICLKCGVPVNNAASKQIAAQIPNHLTGSILVTLFCCQIFGIIAIVYAAQVNSKLRIGDIQGATDSSNKAKMWMWWCFGIGLIVNIIVAISQISAILASV